LCIPIYTPPFHLRSSIHTKKIPHNTFLEFLSSQALIKFIFYTTDLTRYLDYREAGAKRRCEAYCMKRETIRLTNRPFFDMETINNGSPDKAKPTVRGGRKAAGAEQFFQHGRATEG